MIVLPRFLPTYSSSFVCNLGPTIRQSTPVACPSPPLALPAPLSGRMTVHRRADRARAQPARRAHNCSPGTQREGGAAHHAPHDTRFI